MKRGCDEMQDIFGEELKKILQNSKIQVPKAWKERQPPELAKPDKKMDMEK